MISSSWEPNTTLCLCLYQCICMHASPLLVHVLFFQNTIHVYNIQNTTHVYIYICICMSVYIYMLCMCTCLPEILVLMDRSALPSVPLPLSLPPSLPPPPPARLTLDFDLLIATWCRSGPRLFSPIFSASSRMVFVREDREEY